MEPILTLSYTPEKQDYIRASRVLSKKSPWFLILAAIIMLLIMGSGIVLLFPGLAGASIQSAAPFMLIAGLVYLLYIFFLIPMQLSKAYQKNPHLRMGRTMRFYPSQVTMQIGEQSVNLPLGNLSRVIDGGEYCLMLFRGDEQVFPFIPERAFENPEDKDRLLDFFKAHAIPVI